MFILGNAGLQVSVDFGCHSAADNAEFCGGYLSFRTKKRDCEKHDVCIILFFNRAAFHFCVYYYILHDIIFFSHLPTRLQKY